MLSLRRMPAVLLPCYRSRTDLVERERSTMAARATIGAFIIRIGFWGILYYILYNDNSIGNYLGPCSTMTARDAPVVLVVSVFKGIRSARLRGHVGSGGLGRAEGPRGFSNLVASKGNIHSTNSASESVNQFDLHCLRA